MQLGQAGCVPGNLSLVILTGGGADYAGNCAFLQHKYRANVAMHCADLGAIQGPLLPSSQGKGLLGKMMMKALEPRLRQMYEIFERFTPDLYLQEGSSLQKYGLDAKIVHVPGHSPGGISIMTSEGVSLLRRPDWEP